MNDGRVTHRLHVPPFPIFHRTPPRIRPTDVTASDICGIWTIPVEGAKTCHSYGEGSKPVVQHSQSQELREFWPLSAHHIPDLCPPITALHTIMVASWNGVAAWLAGATVLLCLEATLARPAVRNLQVTSPAPAGPFLPPHHASPNCSGVRPPFNARLHHGPSPFPAAT